MNKQKEFQIKIEKILKRLNQKFNCVKQYDYKDSLIDKSDYDHVVTEANCNCEMQETHWGPRIDNSCCQQATGWGGNRDDDGWDGNSWYR